MKTESGKGYFVLASEVGASPWELLVKNAGDAADALTTLPLGSTLEIVGPARCRLLRASGWKRRHVAIAVVGSALGVARPVLARRIRGSVAGSTHLFLGVRAPTDVPIAQEVEAWSAQGRARRALPLARRGPPPSGDRCRAARRVAGYVQHALARALEAGDVPHGTLVIAAGPDAMLADMRALGTGTSPSEGAVLAGPSIEVLTNV